ncbi:MAG: Acetyltransferase (isoleucine patch superfamily)-like protein [Devosia sp.]|uniref:acyltransferase n=1 Tax=Devosia sp. TaxID=1871048 RepID=UPI002603BA08|nr:acyltransferase [Devosia sp.]MDB5539295.1 Acetyltransferase (isoleucine patch superfamily)-like protein [Devosia sp.]
MLGYVIANFMLAVLPPTRLFGLKRMLLNRLGVRVGKGTSVCGGVRFYGAGRIIIGEACWIGLNCKFYTSKGADVTIGDRCDIAPDARFVCGTHDIGGAARRAGTGRSSPIRVSSGTWIGTGSIVLGGAEIGEASVVGAGAVVLSQAFEPSSLLIGVPARVARQLGGQR